MIRLSPQAESQVDALLEHYERLNRTEAMRNLVKVVEAAAGRIGKSPNIGLPAPRPYPLLADLGLRWMKEGSYWIAFTSFEEKPTIVAVFHEAADIPNRI